MGLTVSGKDSAKRRRVDTAESGAHQAAGEETVTPSAGGKPDVDAPRDRLFVNHKRTKLVRIWADGTVETAERATPSHTWGPPTYLTEERYG